MISNLQRSDGGRSQEFANEKLDCCVRAYAIAFDVPYYAAHEKFKAWGRKDRHKTYGIHAFMNREGYLTYSLFPEETVQKFIKTHTDGVYIVRIRGHVFVLKGGVVYDTSFWYERSRVTHYWKVK